jgi:RluA family pseudouridine synthase
MPEPVVNIAVYKFAHLHNLRLLREELRALCLVEQLKGTILLSVEGINLFVAGSRRGVDSLLARMRRVDGLGDLEAKESFSDQQPFHRMLVKIKREIIPFGVPEIDPRNYTSRRVTATELKSWIDESRPVVLLDTRNNFEVQAGTFRNALAVGVDDFRELPQAVERLPESLKEQTVVTFCTGGIRCEKAAPYLESVGFREVYQLDGGILKYLETCGGQHYLGDCFVFDQRVALNAQLQASGLRQCFVCQAILTDCDQASPVYVEGVSCPHCHRTEAEAHTQLLERRHAALRAVVSPLPGSVPYDNVRPISVPQRLDGVELLNFLEAMRTHLHRDEWRAACEEGRLVCRGEQVRPGRVMRAGERLLHTLPATQEPDVAAEIRIVHEDDALIVVAKPAPLPMHPCGRFNRNTLSYILGQVYHPLAPRPAHRLDADTSGVVVFTKSRQIARQVQQQFTNGSVRKTYLARVQGKPTSAQFTCDVALSTRPGDEGVRLPDADGAKALTHFRVLHAFSDGTTLLEVEPLTGRTNQIRAHLWHMEMPIVGDPIYLPQRQLGSAQSLSVDDPPLCLHAATIALQHPRDGRTVSFAAPNPAWAIGDA